MSTKPPHWIPIDQLPCADMFFIVLHVHIDYDRNIRSPAWLMAKLNSTTGKWEDKYGSQTNGEPPTDFWSF